MFFLHEHAQDKVVMSQFCILLFWELAEVTQLTRTLRSEAEQF